LTDNLTLAGIDRRLRAAEDRLAIIQLMMSHPLAIDGRALSYWRGVFTADTTMDRGAPDPEAHSGPRHGSYGLREILEEAGSPELDRLREGGLVHSTSVPCIELAGDEAVATNYTQLITREDGAYRVRRVVANRWELVRQDGGWKIRRRLLRLIDGNAEAREILSKGVAA
jgi:hypothetical protein